MAKNLKRSIPQMFRVDESELDLVMEKMKCAGINNKEAYFRKMVLDGYIVRVDLGDIRKMVQLLSNSSSNINQIAKRVNTDGSIFASGIRDIQDNYELLWEQVREILTGLSKIKR